MKRLVSIGEAVSALGVSITTLRRWEASSRLAAEHTAGGHRRYDLAKLKPERFRADAPRRTVAYEEDLAKDVLEIITVFSTRLYGSRSRKNQTLLDGVKAAVEASPC